MSTTWKRPKLKISKTKSEWSWNVIGYSVYICSIILLITNWDVLPKEVPAHYNAAGEVDRWGSKWELTILPIISALLTVFMEVMEKYPEVHNYPQRFNESNAATFYLLSRKLVNQLKNMCLMIFSLVLVESISIALHWSDGFGVWFLPTILLGSCFPIVVGIIRQRKIN
jgi:uncharacterized membrane protein